MAANSQRKQHHPRQNHLPSEPTTRLAPAPATHPIKLGTHLGPTGVTFAVFASHASAVELCLINPTPTGLSEERYLLHGPVHGVWHGTFPRVTPGQYYGYRVWGPWDPAAAQRHNPAKILLDPYARAIAQQPTLSAELYSHRVDKNYEPTNEPLAMDTADSLPVAALGAVTTTNFPITPRPLIPWENTVIYEAHVVGLTKQMEQVPAELRGTYAGVAHPACVQYLKDLGVTTLELLPIHAKMSEPFLTRRDLDNYWGYSTLSFFAPEPTYATAAAQAAGPQAVVDEVRGMVSLLHQAGIEVVLDVVYNHSCEGGEAGPSVSLRGLDNTAYYLHDGAWPNKMVDYTGCGNSLDFTSTPVVRLTLDSLRYWVEEVGIDGFRFDLAVSVGRNGAEFTPNHPLLVGIATDPVLSEVKMIAEPWDLGPGGWRTGQFPLPFADWNDRYRDAVRSFWLADASALAHGRHANGPHELATRISGSADLFGHGPIPGGRGPLSSVNYITAHDGFTLRDLVQYDHKHNEANKEDNRDGSNNNLSWNHGFEGPILPIDTTDVEAIERATSIIPMRLRNLRNMWGTLAVSSGTPMFVAGDEIGRSQKGNNNSYCQNNEISWVDWDLEPWQESLRQTARYLLQLRGEHPVMRPPSFATGAPTAGDVLPDLSWYDAAGNPLSPASWHDPKNRVLQMLRSGAAWGDVDMLVVFNGTLNQAVVNPPKARSRVFRLVWDSLWPDPDSRSEEDVDLLSISGFTKPVRAESKLPTVDPTFAEELGATPSYGIRIAEAISELPVTVHGMASQMEALSMRIFFAEVPSDPTGDPKIDLLKTLNGLS